MHVADNKIIVTYSELNVQAHDQAYMTPHHHNNSHKGKKGENSFLIIF